MPKHILVVEDDLMLAKLYEVFLRCKHVAVSCATSLLEAQTLLKSMNSLDAVVLDNHLGDGDGLSLLPQVKQRFSDSAVIMVSADADSDQFVGAFNRGIDDYLIKPVNLDLLWIKLQKSCQSYRLARLNAQQQLQLETSLALEKREHELARHVFDTLVGATHFQTKNLQVFSRPRSIFCGDLVLHKLGSDGSYYLMLADSMGHGLAAAIALLPVVEVFQAMSQKSMSLSHLVFELNSKLYRQLPDDRFVAAVILRLSFHQQQLEIWNGGMPALLLLNADNQLVYEANSQNMALGILNDEQLDLTLQRVPLTGVKRIVGYSDGLTDNVCCDGRQLDKNRILAMCEESQTLASFLGCLEDLQHQHDDMTVLSLDIAALADELSVNERQDDVSGVLAFDMRLEGSMLARCDVSGQLTKILQSCDMDQRLCNKSFAVLTELFLNALEHGVLGMDSALKYDDGFVHYYEEKQRRLANLHDEQFVHIRLHWQSEFKRVEVYVQDSGAGFDTAKAATAMQAQVAGRGLSMLKTLCHEVEYLGSGNQVRVVING